MKHWDGGKQTFINPRFMLGHLRKSYELMFDRPDGTKTEDLMRRMAALHERVALLEMTRHEFLDGEHRVERSTFSDGTTVTVDWSTQSVVVKPDLSVRK